MKTQQSTTPLPRPIIIDDEVDEAREHLYRCLGRGFCRFCEKSNAKGWFTSGGLPQLFTIVLAVLDHLILSPEGGYYSFSDELVLAVPEIFYGGPP